MTSGRNVLELFQTRGWNTIVTDNLIYRAITMVSVVIGAFAGVFGMLTAKATGWAITALVADGVDSSHNGMLYSYYASSLDFRWRVSYCRRF